MTPKMYSKNELNLPSKCKLVGNVKRGQVFLDILQTRFSNYYLVQMFALAYTTV